MSHDNPHKDSLPEQRRLRIVAELQAQDAVRADALARRFGVSAETIRRDLLSLEEQGLARRVYGGALRPVSRAFEPPYEQRRVANLERKRAMAALAATLIAPGETLVFDVGTSVAEVARALAHDQVAGRVLTCSLLVAEELAGRPGIEVVVSGGTVRGGDLACSGPTAEAFFSRYFADRAFLGSGGVHPRAGLTDYHLAEIAVRQLIIEHSRECYVLADSTKIGHIAVGQVCPLDALTAVITDSDADPAVVRELEQAGVEVLVAPVPAAGPAPPAAPDGPAGSVRPWRAQQASARSASPTTRGPETTIRVTPDRPAGRGRRRKP
jgi:DeoR family fructose operon transcriptional repressor